MNTPFHLLPSTATVYPGNLSAGKANEPNVAYDTAQEATVRCRIFPLSASESMQYQRETGDVHHEVLLAPYDSAGTAVAFVQATQLVIDGLRYQLDGPSVQYKPGVQGPKLIKCVVFQIS